MKISHYYSIQTIRKVVNDGTEGNWYLDTPVDTGKAFLISLILATNCSHNEIALTLVSSRIAAILLEGHSALKLALNIESNETPTCNISKNSPMTKILQQCNLIVWDERTMAHNKNYERSTVNASA